LRSRGRQHASQEDNDDQGPEATPH
jgi:hypothetical protein